MEDIITAEKFLGLSNEERETTLKGMTAIQIKMLSIRLTTYTSKRQIAAYRAAYEQAKKDSLENETTNNI